MRDLAPITVVAVPPSSVAALEQLRRHEERARRLPQVDLRTTHVLHAGMYARTMFVPAGVLVTGVLVKVPTTLIVSGDVLVTIGDSVERLTGYAVLPAAAMRKQAFHALRDTLVTAIFPTDAATVAEAEEAYTDETDMLLSRRVP